MVCEAMLPIGENDVSSNGLAMAVAYRRGEV